MSNLYILWDNRHIKLPITHNFTTIADEELSRLIIPGKIQIYFANAATKQVHVWNRYGAALAKNTSQNSGSVLRLHVTAKIKVHFAHYRLHVKEVWEISCAVPSTYFEAILPLQCASNFSTDIFAFELARSWARISPLCPFGIHGKKQDLHLSSTRHLHRSPTGVGVGTSDHGLFSPAPEGWKEWLVLPQRHLAVLQGSARLSHTQRASRNRTSPVTEPTQLHSPFSLLPCRPNPNFIYLR